MFGELLFAMYAMPCLLNGSGYRIPGRTAQDECDLRDYIRLAELSSRQQLRLLLIRLFPKAVDDFAELAKISDPVNIDWPLNTVRRYWRALHTGFRNPVTRRTDPNCIPCRSWVLGKHHARQDCYLIHVDGHEVVAIDYHELHPQVGSFIWAHQHVICEIDDDQTEDGEFESRGSPTSEKHCDCGHECKGGHPCPNAPLYIQTGGPEPSSNKPKMGEKSPVGFGNGYGPYKGDGGVPFDP